MTSGVKKYPHNRTLPYITPDTMLRQSPYLVISFAVVCRYVLDRDFRGIALHCQRSLSIRQSGRSVAGRVASGDRSVGQTSTESKKKITPYLIDHPTPQFSVHVSIRHNKKLLKLLFIDKTAQKRCLREDGQENEKLS